MESRGFYNEILTEHNLRPEFSMICRCGHVLEGVTQAAAMISG